MRRSTRNERLIFIEEHLKPKKKYNNPDFFISWSVTLDGKFEYWVRFSMTDDEGDYTDYVQATGDNLEEILQDCGIYKEENIIATGDL